MIIIMGKARLILRDVATALESPRGSAAWRNVHYERPALAAYLASTGFDDPDLRGAALDDLIDCIGFRMDHFDSRFLTNEDVRELDDLLSDMWHSGLAA